MFFAGQFTFSQSSPPARNAMYIRTFYFRIYSRDFAIRHVFLLLYLHWESSKLPCGMQRICGPFVLKTIIMPFKRLFVLWHSLIRSFYFIQVYIFIPFYTFRPILALFTHFTLHQFLTYITTRNIFLIPDEAVPLNLINFYNFSSQRPYLNYLFLYNVYSFDTTEFSMKHKY